MNDELAANVQALADELHASAGYGSGRHRTHGQARTRDIEAIVSRLRALLPAAPTEDES